MVGTLSTGRKAREAQHGFTLVELLIVIVVIAILAAITIIAYNGVTQKAIEATMQSDLRNASTAIELDHQTTGEYPADAGSANGGQGLKASGANQLDYITASYGYCVAVTNVKTSTVLKFKSSDGQITSGDCQAHVTTLAGSGTAGWADGTGAAATFFYPSGAAIDNSGSLYVTDGSNGIKQRVRKITSGGIVTALAGSAQGYIDDTGTAAEFNQPKGMVVDASGNIYVADYGNNRIRKVTPSGVVTTFAGSGTSGEVDGTGTAAQFNGPYGLAMDSSGTIYVADRGGSRIRKITPSGVVTTLAGSTLGYNDGTGSAAQFASPQGIAVDSAGTVYVASYLDMRIRKITPSGTVSTFVGVTSPAGYADGTGTAARFNYPNGLAVDTSNNVYVADSYNGSIRKITPGGVVTTLAGNGTIGFADGGGTSARFNDPMGIAVDGSGVVYVVDQNNHRICKITQ